MKSIKKLVWFFLNQQELVFVELTIFTVKAKRTERSTKGAAEQSKRKLLGYVSPPYVNCCTSGTACYPLAAQLIRRGAVQRNKGHSLLQGFCKVDACVAVVATGMIYIAIGDCNKIHVAMCHRSLAMVAR